MPENPADGVDEQDRTYVGQSQRPLALVSGLGMNQYRNGWCWVELTTGSSASLWMRAGTDRPRSGGAISNGSSHVPCRVARDTAQVLALFAGASGEPGLGDHLVVEVHGPPTPPGLRHQPGA